MISSDPLADLLGQNDPNDPPSRPKPPRRFSTTPLFQPHLPSHANKPNATTVSPYTSQPPSTVRPTNHGRTISTGSDDFGTFVAVPASSDPLSSSTPLSTIPSASTLSFNETAPLKPTPIRNDFTIAAQQRHEENASRILGEFARSESTNGDFLGWLDDLESTGGSQQQVKEQEKHLKREEGPPSPPATPTEGPPPKMKTPRRHVASPEQATPSSDSNGVGSYFAGTIPRRITSFLTSNVVPAVQAGGLTQVPNAPDEGLEESGDPRAIFALPTSSSVARLSSIPHSNFPGSNPPSAKAIPDDFVQHKTPFASTKYLPPSGAPGYGGESGWDTGGFAADWEESERPFAIAAAKAGPQILKLPRILNLVGRKEETAGVLTHALGDVLRLRLPALSRLCTTWTLLYSLDQHGISLHTFYHLSSVSASSLNKVSGGRKGALLIIRDSLDGVFGAWVAEGIRLNHTGEGHFGGGDSFLWRTKSHIPDPAAETPEDPSPIVDFYQWTARNDYVAFCDPTFMSIGGGDDGKTGLFISSSLLEGSSARCITFNNDILCAEETDEAAVEMRIEGRTAKFEIIGLEVWGLVAS